MNEASLRGAIEAAEADIGVLASRFADEARKLLEDALQRRLERLVAERADWFGELDDETARAFRASADEVVAVAAAATAERLRDVDLWLSPMVAPGHRESPETGWSSEMPDWLSRLLHRFGRAAQDPAPGDLDDLSNRAWVHILNAADPLDPILTEFGLRPSPVADIGGAHFGLQPTTLAEIDPEGALLLLWEHYRDLYHRYVALRRKIPDAAQVAVRRWRRLRKPRE